MSTAKTATSTASKNLTPKAPPVADKPIAASAAAEPAKAAADAQAAARPEPPMVSIRDLSDKQLRAMRDSIRVELRRREEEFEAHRPKKGDRVRIEADGRFKGKVGTVIISKKTRAFVDVEGMEQPAYVLHSELAKVEES